MGADAPAELGPIAARHIPIGNDHAVRLALKGLPRLFSVGADHGFMAEVDEQAFQAQAGQRFVFGYENLHWFLGAGAVRLWETSVRNTSATSSRKGAIAA